MRARFQTLQIECRNAAACRSRLSVIQRAIAATCGALILISVAVLVVRRIATSVHPKGVARLVDVCGELPFRTIQARLSGGFVYRPLEAPTAVAPRRELARIYAAAAAAERSDAGRDLHTIGVARLLTGDVEHSIATLERAVLTASGKDDLLDAIAISTNGPLLSDLSAAYYARATRLDRAHDFARALNAAEFAVRSSRTAEAAWNRALATESLHPRGAIEAWEAYLQIDHMSEWAREAQTRIERLKSPSLAERWAKAKATLDASARGRGRAINSIAAEFPEQLRTHMTDVVLPRVAMGDNSISIGVATELAGALCRVSGECLIADSLAAMRTDDAHRREIIEGYRRYAAANAASSDPVAREAHLVAAARFYDAAAYPLAPRVHLQLATMCFESGQYFRGQSHLAIIDSRYHLAKKRSPILAGHVEWIRGLLQVSVSESHEGLASYNRAIRLFTAHRAWASVGGVELLLGENLRHLGEFAESWEHYRRALTALGRLGESPRLGLALSSAARTAARERFDGLASALADAALALARRQGEAAYETQAAVARCQTGVDRASVAEAERALKGAESAWNRIPTEAARARFIVDLQMARAEVAARHSPQTALVAATEAVRIGHERKEVLRLVRAYALRARLARSMGRVDDAERDLRAGIAELETQRTRVTPGQLRASFLETAEDLYRDLADLLDTRGDVEGALNVAENARARVLLDTLRGPSGVDAPLRTADVAERLAPGAAIVKYFQIPLAMLAFVASREHGIRSVRIPWNQGIQQRAVALRNDRTIENAAALYDAIIRPLRLEGVDRVTFVPDRSLSQTPFAMLYDRATGRFLAEHLAMSSAPSVRVALRLTSRSPSFDSMLIVSEPAVTAELLTTLPRLPGAQREAADLANRIPSSRVLGGTEATAERFLDLAKRARIIHFAGHTLESPFDAPALVFAPDTQSRDGLLRVSAIQSQKLDHLQLVVLAACRTSVGDTSTEGTSSLARAFVAAGADAAVASLWPVDDNAYSDFWRVFYDEISRGASAADALQRAQTTMLRNPRFSDPVFWAGYELVGSTLP